MTTDSKYEKRACERLAALEVHVESHTKLLESLQEAIKDVYAKYGDQNKDLTGVLLQLKGVVSQFSEISVKVKELEDDISDMSSVPGELHTHVTECKTWREKQELFRFVKKNPVLAAKVFALGAVGIGLVAIAAKYDAIAPLIKAIFKFFGFGIL